LSNNSPSAAKNRMRPNFEQIRAYGVGSFDWLGLTEGVLAISGSRSRSRQSIEGPYSAPATKPTLRVPRKMAGGLEGSVDTTLTPSGIETKTCWPSTFSVPLLSTNATHSHRHAVHPIPACPGFAPPALTRPKLRFGQVCAPKEISLNILFRRALSV
jgi:hypothetical protein